MMGIVALPTKRHTARIHRIAGAIIFQRRSAPRIWTLCNRQHTYNNYTKKKPSTQSGKPSSRAAHPHPEMTQRIHKKYIFYSLWSYILCLWMCVRCVCVWGINRNILLVRILRAHMRFVEARAISSIATTPYI